MTFYLVDFGVLILSTTVPLPLIDPAKWKLINSVSALKLSKFSLFNHTFPANKAEIFITMGFY